MIFTCITWCLPTSIFSISSAVIDRMTRKRAGSRQDVGETELKRQKRDASSSTETSSRETSTMTQTSTSNKLTSTTSETGSGSSPANTGTDAAHSPPHDNTAHPPSDHSDDHDQGPDTVPPSTTLHGIFCSVVLCFAVYFSFLINCF